MQPFNAPPSDLVTLVNEHDEVIGSMDKVEAHRGKGKRHRAISVYLFKKLTTHHSSKIPLGQPTTKLLLQQRSAMKIVGARQWANTVCGNVRPDESCQECAYRRLREELGITDVHIAPVYTFEYNIQCNAEFSEWEIDQVFVGWYDGKVTPNPDEVQDYKWVEWKELLRQKRKGKKQTFGELEIELTTHSQQLTTTLAPWFVWMLRDEKLKKEIKKYVRL